MRALALSLALAVCALAPSGARAFNEAEKFDLPAIDGGGGGRFFSGSVRDGYTCAVCHMGGAEPEVEITGLPESGYVPGEIYDIEVVLDDDAEVTAAVLELTDDVGARMGTMELATSPGRTETCPPAGEEPERGAAQRMDIADGRQVVAMDACGATRVRVSWRAPAEPRGMLWFHAAVVAGDASSDPTGDGVRVVTRVLPVQGGSATSAQLASGCSASGEPPSSLAGLLALALILAGRRRPRS